MNKDVFIKVSKTDPVKCPHCDMRVNTIQDRKGAPKLNHGWAGWVHTVYLDINCRTKECGREFYVQWFEDCLVVSKEAPVVK